MKTSSIFLTTLINILIFTSSFHAQVPNFQWAKQMGGTGSGFGQAITTDTNGNIYSTGYFQSTTDFDPGSAVLNLSPSGTFNYDIYVQKLDSNGILLWAKQMGGSGSSYGKAITVDDNGNVYTTGYFSETTDFDPGLGTVNLTAAGGEDIFIQKLDTDGNLMWVKQMGGTDQERAHSICIDRNGDIVTTGSFKGTADFDPGSPIVNLISEGAKDIFVLKLDNNGDFIWANQFGGINSENGESVVTDTNNNIYTTGEFSSLMDFDPGAATVNLTPAGFNDIFIQKLDPNGDFIWVKQIGGTSYDVGFANTIDRNGNIYTTGQFRNTVDFDPGSGVNNLTSLGIEDIFIQKLDANGNLLWVRQIGGISNDYGYSIITDANGNVYTTGVFRDVVDFDSGPGNTNNISNGGFDFFIQKLDSSGNFLWVHQIGAINFDYAESIAIDSSGNIYTTGNFQGTVDFDPEAGVTNLTGVSNKDIFILKLGLCVSTSSTDTITACDSFTWMDGITYTASNNTATKTIMNVGGCDSVITLDLTINKVSNDTITLDGDTLTASNTQASYVWLDCNNNNSPLVGETNQTYIASSSGNYAVQLTENNCLDTSNCTAVTIVDTTGVGILETDFSKSFNIFPNPTTGKFSIATDKNYPSINVTIYDANGKITESTTIEEIPSFDIKLKGAPGVYFINIESGRNKAVFQLVKE